METGVGEVRNDQYTAGMGLGIREGLLRTVEGTGACEPWHHPALVRCASGTTQRRTAVRVCASATPAPELPRVSDVVEVQGRPCP